MIVDGLYLNICSPPARIDAGGPQIVLDDAYIYTRLSQPIMISLIIRLSPHRGSVQYLRKVSGAPMSM
jgi:hypothetical protein